MADLVDLAIPANAQAAAEALGLKVHRSVTRAGATNTARGGRDRARMSARLGNPCANSEGHSGRSAAMSNKKDRAWFVCRNGATSFPSITLAILRPVGH